jgi:hypothetical protein
MSIAGPANRSFGLIAGAPLGQGAATGPAAGPPSRYVATLWAAAITRETDALREELGRARRRTTDESSARCYEHALRMSPMSSMSKLLKPVHALL